MLSRTPFASAAGANVRWQPYAAGDEAWQRLGITPLAEQTLPVGPIRLRLTKAGYHSLDVAASLGAQKLTLVPLSAAGGVVRVPAGQLVPQFAGIGALMPRSASSISTSTKSQVPVRLAGHVVPQQPPAYLAAAAATHAVFNVYEDLDAYLAIFDQDTIALVHSARPLPVRG